MSDNLARPEFGKSFSGYKPEEVDPYITKLLSVIDSLKADNQSLEEKIVVLADSVQKYREDEDSLREALLGAQKMSDSIIKNANNKAEITMREASVKASHIIQEAHQKVEAEKGELIRAQEAVASFKSSLIEMYREHIALIARIPSQEKEQAEPVAEKAPEENKEGTAAIAKEASEEHQDVAPAVGKAKPEQPSTPVEQKTATPAAPTPVVASAPDAAPKAEEKKVSDYPEAGQDIFEEFEKRKSQILNFDLEDGTSGRRGKFSDLKFGDQFNLLDDDDDDEFGKKK